MPFVQHLKWLPLPPCLGCGALPIDWQEAEWLVHVLFGLERCHLCSAPGVPGLQWLCPHSVKTLHSGLWALDPGCMEEKVRGVSGLGLLSHVCALTIAALLGAELS